MYNEEMRHQNEIYNLESLLNIEKEKNSNLEIENAKLKRSIKTPVLPKVADVVEKPNIKIKIKGDAGEYEVWGIDWLNQKVKVYRATVYEWIPFEKLKSNFSE